MALTFRRWLTIFVLACAAIVVWQAPVRSGGAPIEQYANQYGFGRQFGWPSAAARLGAANLRLRLLELRDSALGPAAVRAARPGLTLAFDRRIPDPIRQSVQAAMTGTWARYAAGTKYPVLVAVVVDTVKTMGGIPMANTNVNEAYTFLPDSAAPACRVLVRVGYPLWRADSARPHSWRNQVARILTLQSTGREVLGPCALYATFGQPGPQVARWLANTQWLAAGDVDWSRPSPIVKNSLSWTDVTQGGLLARLAGGDGPTWEARDILTVGGVGCVAGNASRCAAAVQAPIALSKDTRAWNTNVIDAENLHGYGRWYWYWVWNRDGSLGPAESWLLSDMVRDLGRERFQTFWTSAAPADSAFARATGEPFGAWLQRWAWREYGRDQLGPWLPVWARWAGLLVVAAGLGVAMVFARERRVA